MRFRINKIFIYFTFLLSFFIQSISLGDNHDINEILEKIQNDIQTLEKAVYSGSFSSDNNNSTNSSSFESNNSEDVLTRHLLK